MSTDGPPPEPVPTRNAQYPWDQFAASEYCDHNYSTLREDDAEILTLVRGWFARAVTGPVRAGLDVGAGPNLYPALSMLPHAETLTLREYSANNVAWLRRQTAQLPEQWRPFWDLVSPGGEYGGFDQARALLAQRAEVEQGSIFDLPRATWDIGTMFFVAESLSQDPAEFEAATTAFVRALRTDSPFAAAFMEHSDGYDVAGVGFPATPVSAHEINACLDKFATELRVHRVEMNPAPLRPGYTGMVVAIGRAK